MFQASDGGLNASGNKLLVPHGWGKTSKVPLSVRLDDGRMIVNDRPFHIAPRESLGKHPDLVLREFSDDPMSEDGFFAKIAERCPGKVVDVFDQLVSYSQRGVCVHQKDTAFGNSSTITSRKDTTDY